MSVYLKIISCYLYHVVIIVAFVVVIVFIIAIISYIYMVLSYYGVGEVEKAGHGYRLLYLPVTESQLLYRIYEVDTKKVLKYKVYMHQKSIIITSLI